ncbi:MAG: hypothetical protein EZS28_004645 [Streblomastix strix]|uniref:Uncharacterized protein n=1 Tax=Streblomastix strix TaxID=222440 RepID=A0A5J4WXL4_9EUKA|nr:MAG: hypothetical protein EZS28_004645 [Streblomastix strix]
MNIIDNLDKENEVRTLEKKRIEQTRNLRKDQIDSNPTTQVDRTNPQSPHLLNFIEQAIALEVDEREPLPNYTNDMQDAILINTTISSLRINFNQDFSSKINFTYPPPDLANNNQPSFFEQQIINDKNRIHQHQQPPMQPENRIQPQSPQKLYQIREVDPYEEDDLDKQIRQLQEERDMMQLRFEQEVHETIFGDLVCPSDLDDNEMNKQSQSENSEEAKDSQSVQDEKGNIQRWINNIKTRIQLKPRSYQRKRSYKKSIRKWTIKVKVMTPRRLKLLKLRKNRGRHKRGKKAKVQQLRIEMNTNNMNENQNRNFGSGTRLLHSKPEVKKEMKPIPNRSKVLQDNHTSYLIQRKGELLTPKLIRVGLNVDSGMSNYPTLRLKQFSFGSISSQRPLFGFKWNELIQWRSAQSWRSDFLQRSNGA